MKTEKQRESLSTILEATLAVVVEGGIDSVRYRAVADKAGVSLGTVSYHFKSREHLLSAALVFYLEENTKKLAHIKESISGRGIEDLAQFFVEICRHDFEDTNKRILAEYELMVFAARDPKISLAVTEYEKALVNELARELDSYNYSKPFLIATLISEVIRGFQILHLSSESPDFDALRSRLMFLLENGTQR